MVNLFAQKSRSFWICLFAIVLVLLNACSRTPVAEQFVAAKGHLMLSMTEGTCRVKAFDFVSDPGTEGLNPESIGVFDWNTYKGQMSGWQDDLITLSTQSDLIVLQEASRNEQMEEFLRRQKLYWSYNSAFKYKGVETGVLTASKQQPLYSCGLRQDEPVIGLPKTAIVSLYGIEGVSERLLIANVHAINITLGTNAYKKQFSALQKILQEHRGPMLVVGDFNNWNEKRTAIVNLFVENLGLIMLPFERENRTLMWGSAVDHVFFRGLEPIEHASHKVSSSDHNPIEVRFRLAQ